MHQEDAKTLSKVEQHDLSVQANKPGTKSVSKTENDIEAPKAKPLTAQEKMRAISTSAEENDEPSKSVNLLHSRVRAAQASGCLPIAYRSGRAPAKQNLELCHGRSSLRNVAVV